MLVLALEGSDKKFQLLTPGGFGSLVLWEEKFFLFPKRRIDPSSC